jgi:hypothetical protein
MVRSWWGARLCRLQWGTRSLFRAKSLQLVPGHFIVYFRVEGYKWCCEGRWKNIPFLVQRLLKRKQNLPPRTLIRCRQTRHIFWIDFGMTWIICFRASLAFAPKLGALSWRCRRVWMPFRFPVMWMIAMTSFCVRAANLYMTWHDIESTTYYSSSTCHVHDMYVLLVDSRVGYSTSRRSTHLLTV